MAMADTVKKDAAPVKVVAVESAPLTVGTVEWRDAVKAAQDLNHAGKYAEAVKAAPLSYQKTSYALNYLRQLMGGVRGASGNWGGYKVEYETDKTQATFAGTDKELAACRKQIKVVRSLIAEATDAGYADKVAYIEPFLAKYEDGILR